MVWPGGSSEELGPMALPACLPSLLVAGVGRGREESSMLTAIKVYSDPDTSHNTTTSATSTTSTTSAASTPAPAGGGQESPAALHQCGHH